MTSRVPKDDHGIKEKIILARYEERSGIILVKIFRLSIGKSKT